MTLTVDYVQDLHRIIILISIFLDQGEKHGTIFNSVHLNSDSENTLFKVR